MNDLIGLIVERKAHLLFPKKVKEINSLSDDDLRRIRTKILVMVPELEKVNGLNHLKVELIGLKLVVGSSSYSIGCIGQIPSLIKARKELSQLAENTHTTNMVFEMKHESMRDFCMVTADFKPLSKKLLGY